MAVTCACVMEPFDIVPWGPVARPTDERPSLTDFGLEKKVRGEFSLLQVCMPHTHAAFLDHQRVSRSLSTVYALLLLHMPHGSLRCLGSTAVSRTYT